MVGIVRYGVHIPRFRIKVSEIAKAWHRDGVSAEKSLGVFEKAVADRDEDAATLAVQAGLVALNGFDAQKIGAVYVGSESHPYAVKPTATIVGGALGIGPDYLAADLQFACKAGTSALQIVSSLVHSGQIAYGLAVGTDTAQSMPGDALEYTAANGAAAFVVGNKNVIAEIETTTSYCTDTPDFWRPQKSNYPEHSGRFTGEPAYFHHVITATKSLIEQMGVSLDVFDYVVFHMPNGSFPRRVAKQLGVSDAQLAAGFVVPEIGNAYAAASLIGLASVLDVAKAGERILVTSYGSGAGADAFALKVTDEITDYKPTRRVADLISDKEYVSYTDYTHMRGKMIISVCQS